MQSDQLGFDLQQCVTELARAVADASIRGTGNARFLYAKHKSRAVEVSPSSDGGWWVEFWENEDVANEHTYQSREDATEAAGLWLAGNAT